MGNTLVLTRNLCPGNILNMIKKYKIEFIQMVPTLMNRLAKLEGVGKEDFASLKALCHTGGVCSPWLKQIWIDLLGPEKIYEMYSMTECIGLTCIRGEDVYKRQVFFSFLQYSAISITDGDLYMHAPFLNTGTRISRMV